ncbi:hypothetical protein LOK49_LG08G01999 [Camellia lanceoleosa]|uniref:Uncharacterized protein n=1 Tax=Camellia lanceoleosa TaxID=1840588 RepID=A0ACC0GRT1_9ERIC|nr:hypothetical protein LOK49_LG08G01999 [Camellia lanceoleosa]
MKFSSSENLSHLVPCDGQTSSPRSPTFSAGNGDTTSLGALYNPNQQMSEYDFGDFVMPENMVSSYGEASSVRILLKAQLVCCPQLMSPCISHRSEIRVKL